ncbi:hypothetical protein SAMN05216266_14713 [Amycolatopsis marina]|uniref:Helix-turn-helix domain-containing protein n=2 Tax=Amycolatopsis marina TaxID=490629 RepID=A0A1I1CQI2_9PSEU|nr:hypothetical protein SAMN05216266_14713 [Amycolatopsis marina]
MTTAQLSAETLGRFATGIGEAMRFERNRRGWTRKEMRREMGTGRSLQTMATHELGTRAMSLCQFIEYCHVLDVAPGPMVDRVYRDVVDTRENAIVIADLDKLARSEYPNLAAWAEIRLRSLPASARGMLPLPRQAQDALAALCKFERRQLLEILGAA